LDYFILFIYLFLLYILIVFFSLVLGIESRASLNASLDPAQEKIHKLVYKSEGIP
jgi:hypothetical protein